MADSFGYNQELMDILVNSGPEGIELLVHLFGSELGTPMLIVWCTCMGLAAIFFSLRIGVRMFGSMGLRMDDWMLVISFTTATAAFVMAIIEYKNYYLGRGLAAMLLHAHPVAMLKMLYAQIVLYIVSISFSKFSFLGLYWLLLSRVDKLRWFLIASTVYIVVGSLGLIFWKCFVCIPINRNWEVKDIVLGHGETESEKCRVANFTALYGTYAFTIVADVIMIALSLPLLHVLRRPMREKIGIFAMFGLTFLSMVAATARVVVSALTQDIVIIMGAAGIEMALCVIIVSIPALRTLVRMKRDLCNEAHGRPSSDNKKNMRANEERIEAAVADVRPNSYAFPMSPMKRASQIAREKHSREHIEEIEFEETRIQIRPVAYHKVRQTSLHSIDSSVMDLEMPPRRKGSTAFSVPEEDEENFPSVPASRAPSEFDSFDFQLPFPYKPSPLTSPCATSLCHSRNHSTTSIC